MNTIVMNTLTGAVTEYADFPFDSITETHAGNAAGLYTLGGDTDNGDAIVAEVLTGETLWDSSLKKRVEMVYFSIPEGSGEGELIVKARDRMGDEAEYRYGFPVRAAGQSRAQPGKGIRENYLTFGFSNPAGDAFTLDRIEVAVAQSKTRRV